jgi:uncharacterized protein YjlB
LKTNVSLRKPPAGDALKTLAPCARTEAADVWFKDDGLIPNHPRWPLVIYKGAARLPEFKCLKATEDFLVIGAYPPSGTYDECTSPADRKKALATIPK